MVQVKEVKEKKLVDRNQKGLYCHHCFENKGEFNETLTKHGKNTFYTDEKTGDKLPRQRYICHTCGRTDKVPLTQEDVDYIKEWFDLNED